MTLDTMYWPASVAVAYVLGSVPFGLIFTRLFTDVDIRQLGSGNIGATNVRRLTGNFWGILTLVCDVGKGALPVWLTAHLFADAGGWAASAPALAGLAAFWGHCHSLFLGGRGGKGVATAGGAFLLLSPVALAGASLTFVVTILTVRRSSAASLAAAAFLPLGVPLVGGPSSVRLVALVMAAWIAVRHRDNICRLWSGTELHP